MDLRQAIVGAAALAGKGDKIAILQSRHDVPAGVVYRGAGFSAHFALEGHDFPMSFVLDAKEAAAAARKAKATTWDLVLLHNIPTKLTLKGEGPEQTIVATPCTTPETWFPLWPSPANELKDTVFRSFDHETWNAMLSVIQKAQDDKIRLGLRCARFTPWGLEAGDEAHYARARFDPPMNDWSESPLLEALMLDKLPKVKPSKKQVDLFNQSSCPAVGFTNSVGYVQVGDERRVLPRAEVWFPPLDKLLPSEFQGCPEIVVPVNVILKFLRSIKKKAERRRVEISTVQNPSGSLLLNPLDCDTVSAMSFECASAAVQPALSVCVDGNRLLESLRVWPTSEVSMVWIQALGSRTLLRMESPGYVEHLFPLVPLEEVQP